MRRLVALAPATGVWHAAGVLADGLLPKQSAATLARVCAPKAHGGHALQQATARLAVRACALFEVELERGDEGHVGVQELMVALGGEHRHRLEREGHDQLRLRHHGRRGGGGHGNGAYLRNRLPTLPLLT